jgi:hypothetical protein
MCTWLAAYVIPVWLAVGCPAAWGQSPKGPVKTRGFLAPPVAEGLLGGGGDDCSAPELISGSGPFPFDTSAATTSPQGQSNALCFATGAIGIEGDVWFQWTASSEGSYEISTCFQTLLDSKIAVYGGAGCPSGEAIACNDDGCGMLESRLVVCAAAGSVLTIQIGTYPGSGGGTGTFTITPLPQGGGNDDCSSPLQVVGNASVPFDLSAATTSCEGWSNLACLEFGTTGIENDLWFAWTPLSSGQASVSTCGSAGIDTRIAAYSGSGCPSAPAIACNDDACGLQSMVQFPVVAGSTYTVQVGVFPGAGLGPGTLLLSSPGGGAGTGKPYCFGDGVIVPCPCGNATTGAFGCVNSTGEGAKLAGSGSASVAVNDLALVATQLPPGVFGAIHMGSQQLGSGFGAPFGDGLLCVGGSTHLFRVETTRGVGFLILEGAAGKSGGLITAGSTWNFQAWFRDVGGPCGKGSNLSNALEVTFTP